MNKTKFVVLCSW